MTAQRLWRRLEAETGTTLLTTTGQVTFGDDLDVLVGALAAGGAPYELDGGGRGAERFPALSVPGPAVWSRRRGSSPPTSASALSDKGWRCAKRRRSSLSKTTGAG